MSCNAYMMRRAYFAEKAGSWEGFKEAFRDQDEISEWALARVEEASDKVASDDVGRLSIAQDILRKSTDFLKRITAPASGVGSVTLSHVCPYCNCLPLEDYTRSVSSGHGDGSNRLKKQCSLAGQYDWRAPKRLLVIQLSAHAHDAKVFKSARSTTRLSVKAPTN